MHVVDFDRYRMRLSLECPLVGAEARTRRAFDVYSAELVRDDETSCATAEVYFVRVDDPAVDHVLAAMSKPREILFVSTTPGELPFWRDTIGARPVGDFVVASGARRLPTYPSPPRPPRRAGRSSPPRLRVLGKPRESN